MEHSAVATQDTKRDVQSTSQSKTDYEAKELPEKSVPKEKNEQEIEDDLLASSDDAVSIENDGIDLFASEESESENEGRFKSRSSKTERTTTTAMLSFTKLGTVNALVVRDLNEVRSDKATSATSSRKDRDSRRDRDRDRDRNGNGRNNRRNDRFGVSRKSGSRDRDRGRSKQEDSRGRSWKSSKHESRKDDDKLERDSDKHRKGSPKQVDDAIKRDVNDKRKSNLEEGIFILYTFCSCCISFQNIFIFIGCINLFIKPLSRKFEIIFRTFYFDYFL